MAALLRPTAGEDRLLAADSLLLAVGGLLGSCRHALSGAAEPRAMAREYRELRGEYAAVLFDEARQQLDLLEEAHEPGGGQGGCDCWCAHCWVMDAGCWLLVAGCRLAASLSACCLLQQACWQCTCASVTGSDARPVTACVHVPSFHELQSVHLFILLQPHAGALHPDHAAQPSSSKCHQSHSSYHASACA